MERERRRGRGRDGDTERERERWRERGRWRETEVEEGSGRRQMGSGDGNGWGKVKWRMECIEGLGKTGEKGRRESWRSCSRRIRHAPACRCGNTGLPHPQIAVTTQVPVPPRFIICCGYIVLCYRCLVPNISSLLICLPFVLRLSVLIDRRHWWSRWRQSSLCCILADRLNALLGH